MDSGWSLKHLHRLIVDSATYRQSSHVTPELLARDPVQSPAGARPAVPRRGGDRARHCAGSQRAARIRRLAGRASYPPLPAFLLQPPVSYGPKIWPDATGPERYRRALYTFRFRSLPYPMLQTFDAPNGDSRCVRRPRSNTPLQALTTLNEPCSMECAAGIGAADPERRRQNRRRAAGRCVSPLRFAAALGRRKNGVAEFLRT